LSQRLVQTEENGVHSFTDPVSEVEDVLVFISSNSLGNFVDDFNVVNQDGLSDVVDERLGVGESLSEGNKLLDVSFSSLAVSGSLGEELDGLSEEDNTFLDLSGDLGLDVSNSDGDVLIEGLAISNAGLDVVEDLVFRDTLQESLSEGLDVFLGVNVGLDVVRSETEFVGSESANGEKESDENEFVFQ
jgi:hypothetical protein